MGDTLLHVLGIDLATRQYADIGIALLTSHASQVQASQVDVQLIRPGEQFRDPPTVVDLVQFIARLNQRTPLHIVAVDGPQGWQDPRNGLTHARVCERCLNTQAKMGAPGSVKPGPSLRFAQFSVDLFDALAGVGWPRYNHAHEELPTTPVAIEVYPTAGWRALGLRPLPSKATVQHDELARWLGQLQVSFRLALAEIPTHDELQAMIAGLVGLALASGDHTQVEPCGLPPQLVDGHWREGPIVNFRRRLAP